MSHDARPAADEYDPYYSAYIDRIAGNKVDEVLRQQKVETETLLSGLTDEAAIFRYAPDKWTVKEVVGHICDTERIFAYRALCIARGDDQALPGMDQDLYAAGANFDSRSVQSLAEEYATIRSATLSLFDNLDSGSWLRRGVANGVGVSVRALAYIIAGHESHHIHILRERYKLRS